MKLVAWRGRKLGKVVEDRRLRNRHGVFFDRAEAGRYLAGMLKLAVRGEGAVLAIPAGGVPVGVEVALALGLDFGLAVVRKVLIPWNREAGYGAVAWDGTVLINEKLRWMLGLPEEVVEKGIEEARRCVRERVERFLKILPQPRV
ncbi:MAG: phosphoribosyltransferase, partial [Candidatus Verstraetearchaeota archaeon]|nr:phosphoribosyltransferase [Candidatus Verstraetearchaeota archaeon]